MNRERALEIVRKAASGEADIGELMMLKVGINKNWVERTDVYEGALSALMDFVETLFTTIPRLANHKSIVKLGINVVRAAHGITTKQQIEGTVDKLMDTLTEPTK